MIEHERGFNFTWSGIAAFIENITKLGITVDLDHFLMITDYYLDKNTRVRQQGSDYYLVRKSGNKASGSRLEEVSQIDGIAADILKSQARLTVVKRRHAVNIGVLSDEMDITIDIIEQPMQLAVLEVECKSPVPTGIAKTLFGVDLVECPLSAWNLFKRKVGICGGPSSGKTETAKGLSHQINTELQGNSFHVTEYATSFIQKYQRLPQFMDQFFIWYGQRQREIDASKADIVISDCPTFLPYIYTVLLNQSKYSPELALYFSKLYKRALFDVQSYTDLYFLQVQEYKENNVRYHSMEQALAIEARIRAFLEDHRISHKIVTYADAANILNTVFYLND